MTLSLVTVAENGAPLSMAQHDANLVAIETAVNGVSGGGGSVAAGWAGTGSIARTLQELALEQPLSAGYFGAVGNGTVDDTAAIQLLINNTPAGQEVQLDGGKFYSISNLTLQNYTKLNGNGAILEARAGTTAMLTVPAGVPLQTTNRLVISNLMIDGKDVVGVRGIDMLNHASVVLQNVGIKQCDVGLYIVGAQFGSAYSVRLWDNVVGLYLRGHPTAGGANSWSFNDLSCIGNTVGMVVNRGEYFTSHSNYFRNPVLLDNSVCAAAFFNCYDCTLDGCSNEINAAGAATHVFDGLTIKKSSIYVNQGHLQLVNPRISEAAANPCILVENGGKVTQSGTISGYGSTSGQLVDCADVTSMASAHNIIDIVGTSCLPGGVTGTVMSAGCALVLPPTTYFTEDIPNEATNPYMSAADTTGATAGARAISTLMGPVYQVTYAASAGSQTTNRSRWGFTGSVGRRAIAFNVMSSLDTILGVGWSSNITNRLIKLKAGIWYRVLHISDEVPTGSQQFIVWGTSANAAVVQFTRWQHVSGAVDHQLIASISTMARGAMRRYQLEATAAALIAVGNAVNVQGKFEKSLCYETTNKRWYSATGSAAADPWRPVGAVSSASDITPV